MGDAKGDSSAGTLYELWIHPSYKSCRIAAILAHWTDHVAVRDLLRHEEPEGMVGVPTLVDIHNQLSYVGSDALFVLLDLIGDDVVSDLMERRAPRAASQAGDACAAKARETDDPASWAVSDKVEGSGDLSAELDEQRRLRGLNE